MGRVQFVIRSRKEYTCSKCASVIPVGDSYYRGQIFRQKRPIIRCKKCKLQHYEVTGSEYSRSVGAIVENWASTYGSGDGVWDSVSEELQSILDEVQESFDNIPYQLQEGSVGSLLQERMDQLEEAISELDFDLDDLLSDAYDNLDIEDQEILDSMRDGKSLDELYVDLINAEDEDSLPVFSRWKESLEMVIAERMDEVLGELSY